MPNALFVPSDGATIPLHAICGIEFPVAFNEWVISAFSDILAK
ncbi:MAG: hypothetical protein V7K38_20605 [Nostoc sp.]